jgi:N6-adenosine-specific RNA methylase IME4
MSVQLIKYDAACRAIAAAKRVDEVKNIRDVSIAMRAYARQADNHEMEADAIEIRMRATRRMDQMRQEQKTTIGLAKPPGGSKARPRKVGLKNNPTLAEAGIDKNLANEGRKLGALSDHAFEKAVKAARETVGKVVNDAVRATGKKISRADRELELGAEQRALPNKRYGVIYADPPWRFEPYSRDTGMDRAADNHYPTGDIDSITNISVPVADDCVLFLWATVPMLPQALHVIAAWGFSYKSHFVWVKDRIGTGYWTRNKHELLLIGTRGDIPAPAPGEQYESVIIAPLGEHSVKPFVVHEMIEEMFPTLPKLEMFARGSAVEGWDAWGNEVTEAAE